MNNLASLLIFLGMVFGGYFALSAFRAPWGRKLRALALGLGCLLGTPVLVGLVAGIGMGLKQPPSTSSLGTVAPTVRTQKAPAVKTVKPSTRATAKPLALVSKPRLAVKPKPRVRVIVSKPKPRMVAKAKPRVRIARIVPRVRTVAPKPRVFKPRAPVRSSKPAFRGRVTCKSFSSWSEAQAYFIAYNAQKLDKNKDGIACESLR